MLDASKLLVQLTWNGPHFTSDIANRLLDRLFVLVGALSDPKNYDRKLGRVVYNEV